MHEKKKTLNFRSLYVSVCMYINTSICIRMFECAGEARGQCIHFLACGLARYGLLSSTELSCVREHVY